MAAAARQQSAMGGWIGEIARLAERALGRAPLLGSTALTPVTANPFGTFGAVVAADSPPLSISRSVREVAVFTVEEARERLKDFIDGKFLPESLNDLIHYLGERFLRLEARTGPQGEVANYIVDSRTRQAVPAAQVDPRLAHAAMLAADLRAAIRPHVAHSSPADTFHSWQGMTLVLDNDPSGIGYTAVGSQGFIGKVHALASADPAENLRVAREAAAKGIRLVMPEATNGSAARGELVAGLPILVRSRSLKAEQVHPGLAHAALSREWGAGLVETVSKMADFARRSAGLAAFGNVVSFADAKKERESFKARFAKKSGPVKLISEQVDGDMSFGGGGGKRDFAIRQVRSEDGRGSLVVFDRDMGEEVPIDVKALPPGRYERETASGRFAGHTDVGARGALRHWDADGQMIRPSTQAPAVAEDARRREERRDEERRASAGSSPGMRR